MKTTIAIIQLDLTRGGNVFDFDLPAGARILHGYVAKIAKRVVVASAIGGVPSEPDHAPLLVMEFDPDAPPRKRRFVLATVGILLDTEDKVLRDGELVYATTIVNPIDNRPLVVYELVDRAEVARMLLGRAAAEGVADDSDRPAPISGEIGAA